MKKNVGSIRQTKSLRFNENEKAKELIVENLFLAKQKFDKIQDLTKEINEHLEIAQNQRLEFVFDFIEVS